MRQITLVVPLFLVATLSAGPARAWSLRDEVTVIDPSLTAELVWEIIDSKAYCQSGVADLDRLSCTVLPDPAEFWIGLDAAGNAYGTVNGVNALGEYFDVYRRPAGTKQSQHIVRITKRKEPVFGQITKIQATPDWDIDPTGGTLLIGLTGSCFSTTCTAQGDTTDHMALIRITGLPTLFELALTYQPPAGLALEMPTRPLALPSADRVDVYYGAAPTLGDLALAMPLACNVAAGAGPGDTVAVADPLPDPPAGEARYYIAAVTSGAEVRAGRRMVGGLLAGRSTTGLPSCP